jgi:lipoyl-dependent peroxiredoxin
MKINRKGSAVWKGGLKDGRGTLSTESGALNNYPYGFASRFEGQRGSNPEELLAAAHAGCFTMALSLILGEKLESGFTITAVQLTLKARIPGTDQATFEKLAATAKANCPVSKLFRTDITLVATLES